jgi:hypothetical protein
MGVKTTGVIGVAETAALDIPTTTSLTILSLIA